MAWARHKHAERRLTLQPRKRERADKRGIHAMAYVRPKGTR